MTDTTIIQPLGPRKIGKYRVESVLGKGAMGIVYAGHDPDIDRPVAIKTVHRSLVDAAGGEDWLARFAREARAAGRVLHPNLVTIFDYLEQDNVPYIVMEKIRSITLEDRLKKPEGLDLQEVLTIASQILDGLSCIHAAGIVHRDMKPANVMLTEAGTVKLTDFGIARITTMDKTGAGMIGTPSYMAPEQFSGAEVDARADIYGVGVLLYEILTGRLPFDGGGIEALLLAAQDGKVTPPSAIVPDLSSAMDAVVLQAMAIAPENRFADAEEMKQALIAAVDGTGAVNLSTSARPKHVTSNASETMLARMSAATMSQVERNLVTKIGPMGQVIARRAAAKATTEDELLELVLSELRQGEEQQDMRASLVRLLSANVGPAPAGISEADLQRLTTLLKHYLGPISTVLVKREAAEAGSVADLIRALAGNIGAADEKAAFLVSASKDDGKGPPNA